MKTLFVLLGPTAVGKTELALRLAARLQSPILNADSRQLYRDLPIGTAAPTADQLRRVKHYFVGTLGLEDYYSAAQYEHDVLQLTAQLFQRHDALLLSGGSMLYIDAVCKGIDDIPTVDAETRHVIRQRYESEGLEPLLDELRLLDADYYASVDRRNTARVLHALEVCYTTGRPFSSFRRRAAAPRPFRVVKLGLDRPRAELFARINGRVDAMLAAGWMEEARRVLPYRHCNALNTVGYKELFQYFDGTWTLEEAKTKIQRNTRVYAKKQLTWFRRDAEVHWFTPDDAASMEHFVDQIMMGGDVPMAETLSSKKP